MKKTLILLISAFFIFACNEDENNLDPVLGNWKTNSGTVTLNIPDGDPVNFPVSSAVSFFNFNSDGNVVFFSFFITAQDTSSFDIQNGKFVMDITSDGLLDTLDYTRDGDKLTIEGHGYGSFAGYTNVLSNITYNLEKE